MTKGVDFGTGLKGEGTHPNVNEWRAAGPRRWARQAVAISLAAASFAGATGTASALVTLGSTSTSASVVGDWDGDGRADFTVALDTTDPLAGTPPRMAFRVLSSG